MLPSEAVKTTDSAAGSVVVVVPLSSRVVDVVVDDDDVGVEQPATSAISATTAAAATTRADAPCRRADASAEFVARGVRRLVVIVTLGGGGDGPARAGGVAVRVVVGPSLVDAGGWQARHTCPMPERGDREDAGPVIAEGRDTEIVTFGPDRVLRRPKRPRPLDGEAAVMGWVLDHGYPCPRVFEVRPEGLVMERIEGVSMLDDL